MLVKVYCVYDKVGEMAGQLICCKNDNLAMRSYQAYIREMSEKDKDFNPVDYNLVCLGQYCCEPEDSVLPYLVSQKPYKVQVSATEDLNE